LASASIKLPKESRTSPGHEHNLENTAHSNNFTTCKKYENKSENEGCNFTTTYKIIYITVK
jgi:hypothetical protein